MLFERLCNKQVFAEPYISKQRDKIVTSNHRKSSPSCLLHRANFQILSSYTCKDILFILYLKSREAIFNFTGVCLISENPHSQVIHNNRVDTFNFTHQSDCIRSISWRPIQPNLLTDVDHSSSEMGSHSMSGKSCYNIPKSS